jgi:hypothetical protein
MGLPAMTSCVLQPSRSLSFFHLSHSGYVNNHHHAGAKSADEPPDPLLDGGGIKGYTSLLILKRILRTVKVEGGLPDIPKPCDVFDLFVGTSTGGIIAVMLRRLRMMIDESIKNTRNWEKSSLAGKLGHWARSSKAS